MIHAYLLRKGKTLEILTARAEMFQAVKEKDALFWVDIENPTEFETECLVEVFNFHPLAIEDCLNEQLIPKMDDYEEYLFMVTHSLRTTQEGEGVKGEPALQSIELDIFLGPNYVVTFHKDAIRAITLVRENAKKKPQHYLGQGSDMLFHAILDQMIDHFQPVNDFYEEQIEKLEDRVCRHPGDDFLQGFLKIKQDVFNLKRMIAPLRDMIGLLIRHPPALIRKKQIVYFRDIYDHLIRSSSFVDGFHESLSNILQAYFSQSNQRLNEIMKRMTVLATLSMPTVIIASVYGMNFRAMPELDWTYGYPFSIALMAGVSLGMLIWMKFKKWI